jgi:hypothetical protein
MHGIHTWNLNWAYDDQFQQSAFASDEIQAKRHAPVNGVPGLNDKPLPYYKAFAPVRNGSVLLVISFVHQAGLRGF